jgi:hypothetical protein
MEDNKTLTFIEKAKLIHKDKYDYSKVKYKNNHTKVCIICNNKDKFNRTHGEFWQTPKDHLKGQGCPKCKQHIFNTEDFILYANDIHKNKYDYSKTIYVKSNQSLTIICPEHGEFNMRPANHLKGQGCPLCANKQKGLYRKIDTKKFIERSAQKHMCKYDYSKVEYVNNHTKVCIICPEHGEFWQKPNDHLRGIGCSQCGNKYNLTEQKILNSLKLKYNNVLYQHTTPFLHGKTSAQTIDFFLPDYNIGIEYHGRQHFIPISKFGGEKEFKKTCERDLKKYFKCQENGIVLYYITFEKCDTSFYFKKVYTDLESLYNDIDYHKNNKLLN